MQYWQGDNHPKICDRFFFACQKNVRTGAITKTKPPTGSGILILAMVLTFFWQVKYQNPKKKKKWPENFGLGDNRINFADLDYFNLVPVLILL